MTISTAGVWPHVNAPAPVVDSRRTVPPLPPPNPTLDCENAPNSDPSHEVAKAMISRRKT